METKEIEGLVEQVKGLSKTVTDAVDKAKSEINTNVDAKVKGVSDDVEATKGKLQAIEADVTEIKQKQATSGFAAGAQQQKSFSMQVKESLVEKKGNLVKGRYKGFDFDLPANDVETKAVGNMSSSGSLTGSYFVAPTVVPGIFQQPFNNVHMRNLLATGNTDSNAVRYVRDNGGEGGPAMVAEGGSKPQIDRDLQILDANVRKIATHFRLPEEMIEDIPYITTFLTNVGTEEVLAVEDAQILYGDGTGQNLSGIATSGNFTAFAAGSSVIGASANQFDVLRAAEKQMRTLKRTPSFALVSPTDYFDMISKKDTTNNYILSGGGNGLVPTLNGVPIIQLNQVTAGDFILMDRNAAQIFFRSNITVRFYEQDQDNAIKNLVTIVIEERLALPIYYITGIIKGTFTAGITDLTS